jgi:ribose transport system permease protein
MSCPNGERRLSEQAIPAPVIPTVSLISGSDGTRYRASTRWGFVLLLPALIIVMELIVALIEPRVLSPRNVINILVQSSYLLVFASAQMVVILTGGFDLSLGTTVSVISVVTALVTTGLAAAGAPMWLVIIAGLAAGFAVGCLVGAFNGAFVSWVGISPFVVTIGSLNICYGLATTISGGAPVFNVPDAFSRLLYDGTLIPGIPVPVVLAIAVVLLLYVLLDRTIFGRSLYLIGNNPRAAHLAGLPSKRYLFVAYITCSLLAAFGALMLTARTGSGEPNLGGSLMLESIAAAIIGGVRLQGGVGGIFPVVLGSIFVTMLSNAMDLLEIGGYVQQITLGGVLIGAVFLDRVRATRL